ncbi:hypothetical protein OG21DRAFT_1503946 [Imleria badia]|nr:hypothetical protein OG21DRAFT_1503946 [Imleria badia]
MARSYHTRDSRRVVPSALVCPLAPVGLSSPRPQSREILHCYAWPFMSMSGLIIIGSGTFDHGA